MTGFAQLIIVGNMGQEIRERELDDGNYIVWFDVAVDRPARSGEPAMWIQVAVRNDLARTVRPLLATGRRVFASGQLHTPVEGKLKISASNVIVFYPKKETLDEPATDPVIPY